MNFNLSQTPPSELALSSSYSTLQQLFNPSAAIQPFSSYSTLLWIWHESSSRYFHSLGMLFEEYHVRFLRNLFELQQIMSRPQIQMNT